MKDEIECQRCITVREKEMINEWSDKGRQSRRYSREGRDEVAIDDYIGT